MLRIVLAAVIKITVVAAFMSAPLVSAVAAAKEADCLAYFAADQAFEEAQAALPDRLADERAAHRKVETQLLEEWRAANARSQTALRAYGEVRESRLERERAAIRAYEKMHSDATIRERLIAAGAPIVDEIAVRMAKMDAVRAEVIHPEEEAWQNYKEAKRAAGAIYDKYKRTIAHNEVTWERLETKELTPAIRALMAAYSQAYANGGHDISGYDPEVVFQAALHERLTKCHYGVR